MEDMPWWMRKNPWQVQFPHFAAEGDEGGDGDGSEGDDDDPDGSEGDANATVSKAEFDKAVKRRQKALEEKRALEKRIADLEAEKLSKDGDDAVAKAKAEVTASLKASSDRRVMKKEAKAALLAAGVTLDRVPSLVKLIDFDSLSVDDDDEVDGLDEQVEDLRKEYPELFKRVVTSRGADGAGRSGGNGKKMSSSEKQALALAGKR